MADAVEGDTIKLNFGSRPWVGTVVSARDTFLGRVLEVQGDQNTLILTVKDNMIDIQYKE